MTKRSMFHTEPEPCRARAEQVAEGILRIVASNPGKMTYHGTNSYIIDTPDGRFILDPGPAEDSAHFEAIVENLGGNPAGILVSHHHSDHFGAVPGLRERTGLPVYVSRAFPDDAFQPDGFLEDGQRIAGLTVLHTPGHASDHLCFARLDGVLFTGDHVMSWNSSIVSPPDGNMRDYCDQLQRLIDRDDRICLPGHGPVLQDPRPYIERLLANRMRRETQILKHLLNTSDTVQNIAASVYKKSDLHIAMAAERNVVAHLQKLLSESRVAQEERIWRVN
ncbi:MULTISPECIES: MBL fold metallo-hydrolase [unclassified Sulfitobacter]|jgi:glyoxylase-like metal-dependent hydrolase (beta-lactamase superfamily II)|uniref:MBL fold metallo-hydrolase n=1 Tax=unclassified Sulfitobacter TaxID=196795 RepID=UPI000AEF8ABB|nr:MULTISPECIES: MBL fold metallo-hydrolase [unclassified Sulfitobacter]